MNHLAVSLLIIGGLCAGCGSDRPAPAAEAGDLAGILGSDVAWGDGTVWRVGPERDFKTPSAVAGKVGNGDVVLIDAATYACDTGVVWQADRLTLKGVGGRPHLAAEGCRIPGNKGIWNPIGTDILIDNIAFSGAAVSDENGAGIRFEGDGQVVIRNAFFHHNENGILFTPFSDDSTDLLIEHSEFAYNGTSSGQAHNLYIDAARSLTFRYNYSHDSHVGHLLKTRARNNHILYNRLMTLDGTGSYEIDIPEGGDAWIIGNVIQQGPVSENYGVIAYGTEAGEESSPGGHLYVIGNTVINDRQDGAGLITLVDYDFAELRLANNLLVDFPEDEIDRLDDLGADLDHNLFTGEPGFQGRDHHNYALTKGAEAVAPPIDPGLDHQGNPLAPDRVHRHVMAFDARVQAGDGPDVGALELEEGVAESPVVDLRPEDTSIDYGEDARLGWTASAAERCLATGDWDGEMAVEGAAAIGPLNRDARFTLTC
ncbi:MAG: right-handed parallel beta-helix repeat-containing protein, partial [Geminicoccaceae bacterium]